MDQDEGLTAVDNIVTQFSTYEDFLDSQITTVDLYYLEDESLARQLVELGYRGTGEVVKREDFEARKAAIEIAMLAERTQKKHTERGRDTGRGRSSSPWGARCGTQSQDPGIMTRAKGRRSTTEPPRTLTSAGKDLQDNFLKALALREEDNRNGKVSILLNFCLVRASPGKRDKGEQNKLLIKLKWTNLHAERGASNCHKNGLSKIAKPVCPKHSGFSHSTSCEVQ
ncbi:cilia- and flagella-associated protein 299 isoform X3 [Canis lupus dingo]|uniref:cilia- and flagella-associated protein 299 isoform X3 n=1 Tax=Canis lupus dingo TaxID=286419 RepID=UPI0020C578CF|nr:cilia- and flagella-associated protein 299 isoform X3 [Canis lupus dingo]